MCLLIAWVEAAHRHRALQLAVATFLITQPRIDLLTNPRVLQPARHHLLAELASHLEQPLTIAIGCEVMTGIRTAWLLAIGSTRQEMVFKRRAIGEHLLEAISFPQPTRTTQQLSIVQAVRKEVANRVQAIACTALQAACAYLAQITWVTIRRRLMQHGWESTE